MDAICLVTVVAEVRRRQLHGVVRGSWAARPAGLWLELLTAAGPEGPLATAAACLRILAPAQHRAPGARAPGGRDAPPGLRGAAHARVARSPEKQDPPTRATFFRPLSSQLLVSQ